MPNHWTKRTTYRRGDEVTVGDDERPGLAGSVFVADVDGTSGNDEPTWTFRDQVSGGTVSDGTLRWREKEGIQGLGRLPGLRDP